MPKLTAGFLNSLVNSVTGIAGIKPDPADKAMMDVLITAMLARQEDMEFRDFIRKEITELGERLQKWQDDHPVIESGQGGVSEK